METNRPNVPGPGSAGSASNSNSLPANLPLADEQAIGKLPLASAGGASKILHTKPALGRQSFTAPLDPAKVATRGGNDESRPLPVAESNAAAGASGKITAFGKAKRHEDCWSRTPNTTGNGAIHVKTFHCKLTEDALSYMDQAINEWLDAHPQYEVKFVSSTIGVMTGKLKEPALYCQVWV